MPEKGLDNLFGIGRKLSTNILITDVALDERERKRTPAQVNRRSLLGAWVLYTADENSIKITQILLIFPLASL